MIVARNICDSEVELQLAAVVDECSQKRLIVDIVLNKSVEFCLDVIEKVLDSCKTTGTLNMGVFT